jgi:hypothetical protein
MSIFEQYGSMDLDKYHENQTNMPSSPPDRDNAAISGKQTEQSKFFPMIILGPICPCKNMPNNSDYREFLLSDVKFIFLFSYKIYTV